MQKPSDIDQYIKAFPKEVRENLERLRSTIRKAAPDAEEAIRYGMPTFILKGNLVHFAAYKNHTGFYPAPSGIESFREELSMYETSKGAIRFPVDRPLPLDLISKIVKFRVRENIEKAEAKKNLKTCSQGHKYYKSSDCPACPVCEQQRKPEEGFLSLLAVPARRALENKGINSLKKLSGFSEAEILMLHGMGPSTMPKLRAALKAGGLTFKK